MKAARPHNTLAHRVGIGVRDVIEAGERVKERDYFRGSDTHNCGKKHWYTRKGIRASNPFPPDLWDKFSKGHLLEEHLLGTVLPKWGGSEVTYRQEQVNAVFEVNGGPPVHILGNVDGVIAGKDGAYLLEVKSTSEWGYRSVVKAFAENDASHYSQGYVKQANRYAYAWNATKPMPPYPRIVGLVILLYNVNGSKDPETGLPWRDWWFELDPELLKADLEFLGQVEVQIQHGQQPERGYANLGWECAGCQWCFECWPQGERKSVDRKVADQLKELEARAGSDPARSVEQGTPASGGKHRRVLGKPARKVGKGKPIPTDSSNPRATTGRGQVQTLPTPSRKTGELPHGKRDLGQGRGAVDAKRDQPRGGVGRTSKAGARLRAH